MTRRSLRVGALLVVLGAALAVSVSGAQADTAAARPVANDCSAGYITFTFDDGPDVHTEQVMHTLMALNLSGVFFVEGRKLHDNPTGQQTIRDLATHGFLVENHTFDHQSFTGASTGTPALSAAQVSDELESTTAEITAAGVAKPTLYRPPFGDASTASDNAAIKLGYRMVESWGMPTGNIIDSRDWSGITSQQIVDIVTKGRSANGTFYQPARNQTIIAMHDGQQQTTLNMIEALQPIADWMNAQHLCSTSTVRDDATGGVIPLGPPPVPTTGNLVTNGSLEQLRATNTASSEPRCFQQGGAGTAGNTATWTQTSDAHSGAIAERLDVAAWASGDRKLVLSQKAVDAACLPAVTAGSAYQLWVSYKGTWPPTSKASLVTYYRDAAGAWQYWTTGRAVAPSSDWWVAYATTPPVPAGATALSWGLSLQGTGTVTTDDYVMTPP